MPDKSVQRVNYFEPSTLPADTAEMSLDILSHAKIKSFTAGGSVSQFDVVSLDVTYATGTEVQQWLGRATRVVTAPASGAATATTNGVVGIALEAGVTGSDFRVVVAGPAKAKSVALVAGESGCVANTASAVTKYIITTQTGATDGPFCVSLTTTAEGALDANEDIVYVFPRAL